MSACVCIASTVKTAPATSANAFSSSRTAGISLTSPRRRPGRGPLMPCARAATRPGLSRPCSSRRGRSCRRWRDHQPPAGPHRPGVQPGAGNPVEHVGADQGERAPVGGLLRRAAFRAECGQHVRGRRRPLPDCRERPRPCDDRRDPPLRAARQRMPALGFFAGPGPGPGDREDASGQPPWAKMSSAAVSLGGRRWSA